MRLVSMVGAAALMFVVGCAGGGADVVRRQFAAFNAQDVDAMTDNVTQDFVWYDVDEGNAKVQVSGRNSFGQQMRDYYSGSPKFESKAMSMMTHGDYVTVMERISYETSKGEMTQESLSVYRIRDGKIARVWYFPAEKVE